MKKINILSTNPQNLWNGCILASIAHAIMVAHYPLTACEHSWDGINYSFQDMSGVRGTISFADKCCSAAFRDENSKRLKNKYYANALDFFEGCSREVLEIAKNETLQYLLENVNGQNKPLITTAFWGDEKSLFSLDTQNDMMVNGAGILERQLLEYKLSISSWSEYYEMTAQQVDLLEFLYKRKIENPSNVLELTKTDISKIGCDDPDGLHESKVSFNEINIILT